MFDLLNLILWLPLLGGILLFLLPNKAQVNNFAIFISIAVFILSLWLLRDFEVESGALQFVSDYSWIPSLGVRYKIGIDGISLFLLLLTTGLIPLVCISAKSIKNDLRGYLSSVLIIESAMIGTLVSLDLFLFFLFWEAMLAPMYLLIGIWGGKRRVYASIKFVLYTVLGSVLMFVAFFYVAWRFSEQSGHLSFVLQDLIQTKLTVGEQFWLFSSLVLAFGIKVPIFPLHTWLPDAHVEAPTGGSVILAGVMLKLGIYGFLRFGYPLFPNGGESWSDILLLLGVIGIIYGSLVAWVQEDIKKLVAYSSVAHLGYCVIGMVALNSIATTGSIYQMLNHGVSTGALFLLVGVLYDRTHSRAISDYSGLASKLPIFSFLFLVFTFSSIALPLTNGFIGEFLILYGTFKVYPIAVCFAALGVILGAVYMLTLVLKIVFGEANERVEKLLDLTPRELLTVLPLMVLVFWMGIFPQGFLKYIDPAVKVFLGDVEARRLELASYTIKPSSDRRNFPRLEQDVIDEAPLEVKIITHQQ